MLSANKYPKHLITKQTILKSVSNLEEPISESKTIP